MPERIYVSVTRARGRAQGAKNVASNSSPLPRSSVVLKPTPNFDVRPPHGTFRTNFTEQFGRTFDQIPLEKTPPNSNASMLVQGPIPTATLTWQGF